MTRDIQPRKDDAAHATSASETRGGPKHLALRAATVAGGLVLGAVSGLLVVLALAGLRRVVENMYVHGFGDFVGWLGAPAAVGLVGGIVAGFALPVRAFWRRATLLMAAIAIGAVLGAAAGLLLGSEPSAPWVGGLIGAGGLAALAWVGLLVRTLRPGAVAVVPLAALLVPLVACSGPAAAPNEPRTMPAPDPAEVESIVFLVGDPGLARREDDPIIHKLRADIERWSAQLGPNANVAAVTLGDMMYPDGLHPVGHELRERDSLRMVSQIAIVSGEAADRAGALAVFTPGNHDWGQEEDWAGARRLVRLEEFLESWEGPAAGRLILSPEPGTGGPGVLDIGPDLRLLLLDTAWWLYDAAPEAKAAVIDSVRAAIRSAGGRRIVMAAHHPLESGGPHGTAPDLRRSLGFRFLLKKAGLLLQDLDSRPYADLRRQLLAAFDDVGHPDVFAGGHEHSLQVFQADATAARRGVVIGSASKLTEVRYAPGMKFGRSEPGYGKLLLLRDGRLHLRIEAAPARYLTCEGAADVNACVEEGVAAYRTVWAEEIEPIRRD